MQKFTVRDFDEQFPDEDACFDWLTDFLYPGGIHCPVCDRVTKHHKMQTRPSLPCDRCGHHEHPMASTIFQTTPTPLRVWVPATHPIPHPPGATGASARAEAERLLEQSARDISAGNHEAALSTLTQAMKADIPRYRAWFRMGGLFFSLGKIEEAEAAFLRATELNPGESKGWYNLGICRAEQERLDHARPAFETCLSLERKFPEAWNWLGLLEFNQGNHTAARRAFVRCLALDRKSKTAWHNLAMLYRAMGNEEEENRCMEHVAELGGLQEKEGLARWKITIRPDSGK